MNTTQIVLTVILIVLVVVVFSAVFRRNGKKGFNPYQGPEEDEEVIEVIDVPEVIPDPPVSGTAVNTQTYAMQNSDVLLEIDYGFLDIVLRDTRAATEQYKGFGGALDMTPDGMSIVVSSIAQFGNSVPPSYAQVFDYDGTSWNQRGGNIFNSNSTTTTGSDVAISADGNTVVIGDRQYNSFQGQVDAYGWNGASWVKKGQTIYGNTIQATNTELGTQVDVNADGTIIIMSEVGRNFLPTDVQNGMITAYNWTGSSWNQYGGTVIGLMGDNFGELFGNALTLTPDGTTFIAGGPYVDLPGSGIPSGRASVYEKIGSVWTQKGQNLVNLDSNYSRCGWKVDITNDGDTIAVTSTLTAGNSGFQYDIYDWNGSAWVLRGSPIYIANITGDVDTDIKIDNTTKTRVLIGNYNTGNFYIYDWSGSAWVNTYTVPYNLPLHSRGENLALSDDGLIMASGNACAVSDGGNFTIHVEEMLYPDVTVTLPNPSTKEGDYIFVESVTNNVLSQSFNVRNMSNILTNEILTQPDTLVTLRSDGTIWRIVAIA